MLVKPWLESGLSEANINGLRLVRPLIIFIIKNIHQQLSQYLFNKKQLHKTIRIQGDSIACAVLFLKLLMLLCRLE